MKKFMKWYSRIFILVNSIYMIVGLLCGVATDKKWIKNERVNLAMKFWNDWTVLSWKLWLTSIINLFKDEDVE